MFKSESSQTSVFFRHIQKSPLDYFSGWTAEAAKRDENKIEVGEKAFSEAVCVKNISGK